MTHETADLLAVAADDAALALLATGARPPGDDPALALLGALRADLDAAVAAAKPADEVATAAIPVPVAPAAGGAAAAPLDPAAPLYPVAATAAPRRGRLAPRILAVAACVALLGAGLAAGLRARPGDALYPVRRIVAGEVESPADRAERLLDEAALALDEARDREPGARAALDRAVARVRAARPVIAEVDDADERAALTRRADRLHREAGVLHAAFTAPSPAPSPSDDDRGRPSDDPTDEPDDPDDRGDGSGPGSGSDDSPDPAPTDDPDDRSGSGSGSDGLSGSGSDSSGSGSDSSGSDSSGSGSGSDDSGSSGSGGDDSGSSDD